MMWFSSSLPRGDCVAIDRKNAAFVILNEVKNLMHSISVGWIPRSLTYSQTSKSPSFPHAFSGNPDESLTGPPIDTFGGDTVGQILIQI